MLARRSIPALLVALALAAGLVLAACGSGSGETTGGPSIAPVAPGAGEPDSTPAPAGEDTAPSGEDAAPTTEEGGGAAGQGSEVPPGQQEAPVGVRAEVCEIGEAGNGEVRVSGIPCDFGRLVVIGWNMNEACDAPADASRTSCKLGGFTCLGARTGRGLAVTCAARGRSVAFLAKPR